LLDVAIQAAKAAGAIQRERFGKNHDVTLKGEVDLVTEVDLACEEALRELFARLTPGVALLGEEGGELSAERGAAERWIFDPLDGTTNYAHGVPHFCSSIAFERDGQIVTGAIYDPVKDELFTAQAGEGARLNGAPIRVTERTVLRQSLLATGFPYDRSTTPRKIFEAFTALARKGRGIRRLGFDAFWEVGLKPWDLSAGALLVKESGGKVSSFDKKFDHNFPDIIASNGHIHSELTEIILNYL
jgi:myo-inositol-1(or 4)-monophosphatase